MEFAVQTEQLGPDSWVLRTQGELDLSSTPDFEAAVKAVLVRDPKLLVADFSRLAFINSTGMYVLLKAEFRLAREGGEVVIVGARSSVLVTLELIGVPQRIRCVNSLAEARAPRLRKRQASRSNA